MNPSRHGPLPTIAELMVLNVYDCIYSYQAGSLDMLVLTRAGFCVIVILSREWIAAYVGGLSPNASWKRSRYGRRVHFQ